MTSLTLDVFALLDGGNKTVKVRTFRDRIPVTATLSQKVQASVAFLDPIWTFVAAVVGGLGGLIIWLWRMKLSRQPVSRTARSRGERRSAATLTADQQRAVD